MRPFKWNAEARTVPRTGEGKLGCCCADDCTCQDFDPLFRLRASSVTGDFEKPWCMRVQQFDWDGEALSHLASYVVMARDIALESISCDVSALSPIDFWFVPTADEINAALDQIFDSTSPVRTSLQITLLVEGWRAMTNNFFGGGGRDAPVGGVETSAIYLARLCYKPIP